MSNANRDYAIVYDVKNSLLVLSRPLIFYITDKNTSNIFVKLVTRVIVGDGIDQYTDIENASSYVLTMRVIKPDDEVKSIIATQHESESIFQFDLTEDFKDVPGKYICELTISNIVNGRQEFTTSDPFNYEVKRSILSNVKNIIEGKDTTVEKLLNDLDAAKAELSSQIKEKANKIDLETERRRIDNLISLPDGSTTNDARLEDIKIGADGTDYESPGNAVRQQFNLVNTDINNIFEYVEAYLTLQNGYINDLGNWITLPDGDNPYFKTTQDIFLKKGELLRIVCKGENQSISIISIHEGGKYIPVVLSTDSTYRTYYYRANKSQNVVCCYVDIKSIQVMRDYERTGYINALNYGFVNDGIIYNDDIMQKYIANDYKTPIYFPPGVYKFNKGFNFDDKCYMELSSEAKLLLDSSDVQDYFITIRKDSTKSDYAQESYIRGGVIDGNFRANTIVGLNKVQQTFIDGVIIKNAKKAGIKTNTQTTGSDGEVRLMNLLIENDYGVEGAIGIDDNGLDTRGNNIEIINFQTGLKTICGRWVDINCWLKAGNIIANSQCIICDGYDIVFTNLAMDTYRYGITVTMAGYGCIINGMIITRNRDVYTNDIADMCPRMIFKGLLDAKYNLNGFRVDDTYQLTWSEVALNNSNFLNIHVGKSDPYNNMLNYRNDNDGLLNTKPQDYIDCDTNFDTITQNGVYPVNLYNGTGTNCPNIKLVGTMNVFSSNPSKNKAITQLILGNDGNILYRVYIAESWSSWIKINAALL